MDIQRLLKALWRKAWIIIILGAMGGGIAYYSVISKYVPQYEAKTTLYVLNIDKVLQKGQSLTSSDLNSTRELVTNFSELIKSRRVTSKAVDLLKDSAASNIDESVLNSIVSLGTQQESNIFVVSAVWTDPQTSALVSNAMSRAFVDTLNGLTNSKTIDILDGASIPDSPLPNNMNKKILIGIIAGIMLGFGIIYLQELFDTTIRAAEDIEQGLNLGVIGIIPLHQIK